MLPLLRTLLLLLPLLLTALSGCFEPRPPSASMDLDRTTLSPGEWVNVTLTLHAPDEFTYTTGSGAQAPWMVHVVGPDGPVALYAYGEEQSVYTHAETEHTVRAGDHATTVQWNGHTKEDRSMGTPHDGARLPPGTYPLVATWSGGFDVEAHGELTLL